MRLWKLGSQSQFSLTLVSESPAAELTPAGQGLSNTAMAHSEFDIIVQLIEISLCLINPILQTATSWLYTQRALLFIPK